MNPSIIVVLKNSLIYFAITLLFTSCSIQKRHYQSGYFVTWKNNTSSPHVELHQLSKKAITSNLQKIDTLAIQQEEITSDEETNTLPSITLENTKFSVLKRRPLIKPKSSKYFSVKRSNTIYRTNTPPPGMIDYSFILYAIAGLMILLITVMIILKAPLFAILAAVAIACLFLVAVYLLMKHMDLI